LSQHLIIVSTQTVSYALLCKGKTSTSTSNFDESEYTGLRFDNVLMDYNVASSDGGAVSARQSVALFRHSKFIDNVSPLGSAVLVYEVRVM
jgi:hypothetical protein